MEMKSLVACRAGQRRPPPLPRQRRRRPAEAHLQAPGHAHREHVAQHELAAGVQAVPALQPLHDVRAGRAQVVGQGKGLAAGRLKFCDRRLPRIIFPTVCFGTPQVLTHYDIIQIQRFVWVMSSGNKNISECISQSGILSYLLKSYWVTLHLSTYNQFQRLLICFPTQRLSADESMAHPYFQDLSAAVRCSWVQNRPFPLPFGHYLLFPWFPSPQLFRRPPWCDDQTFAQLRTKRLFSKMCGRHVATLRLKWPRRPCGETNRDQNVMKLKRDRLHRYLVLYSCTRQSHNILLRTLRDLLDVARAPHSAWVKIVRVWCANVVTWYPPVVFANCPTVIWWSDRLFAEIRSYILVDLKGRKRHHVSIKVLVKWPYYFLVCINE